MKLTEKEFDTIIEALEQLPNKSQDGKLASKLMAKMLFLLPSSNVFILADEEAFSEFLSKALNLVVGVEFVKMLCKHTPETVIEVLLFATARQMIVEHLAVHQILIGTLAIAVLFATRKFLLSSPAEKSTSIPSMKKSEHT